MTLTPQPLDYAGAQRLASAVLIGALTEALQGSPEAIYWLYSSEAAYYAQLAGRDDTGRLVGVARRCSPGRRKLTGRINAANYARALSL